jgi:hypothetical protein
MITDGEPFALYRVHEESDDLFAVLPPEFGSIEAQDLWVTGVEATGGLSLDERLLWLLIDRRTRISADISPWAEGAEAEGLGEWEDQRLRNALELAGLENERQRKKVEASNPVLAWLFTLLRPRADDGRFVFVLRDGLTTILRGCFTRPEIRTQQLLDSGTRARRNN